MACGVRLSLVSGRGGREDGRCRRKVVHRDGHFKCATRWQTVLTRRREKRGQGGARKTKTQRGRYLYQLCGVHGALDKQGPSALLAEPRQTTRQQRALVGHCSLINVCTHFTLTDQPSRPGPRDNAPREPARRGPCPRNQADRARHNQAASIHVPVWEAPPRLVSGRPQSDVTHGLDILAQRRALLGVFIDLPVTSAASLS